ncbi:Nmd5p Ecym_5161 [Eremothecium cymbalariae DBVPG|uniref:Importin N-terminal domain-containing protein n=1 Tax=Eremothecium cymbalariae (strain CBS 270.75 / DBVPG 7215 / KCTC 17166 / NRRL Y-17582) TaxID=931890 RepID=I6NCZ4_ERECY|nr:hypothetical protein Ecym_5161 [Eremothecium cymbalariae DBVPG\
MDVNALLQCFSGTLNHDASIRSNAESQLKELSRIPGFLGACLDIISSQGVPENIKLSASLYFKNKIAYGWSEKGHGKNELLDYTIDNDEKPVVKDMLIKALVQCSRNTPSCIRLLQPALNQIVSVEYSQKRWDNLLLESFQPLSSNDIHAAHIGLLCIAEIFRTYRWKQNDDRQDLELLIVQYFPDLLNYATSHLFQDGANMNNALIGEMVKLVLKIYKFLTYNDLPFTLQRSDSFIPWANFHVKIIQQQLPKELLSSTHDDSIKSNPWIKAKKWAYANLYRLFQRYASESLSKKFNYTEFKSLYIERFLPQLLQLLFQQIEQWGNHDLWLSEESIYYILEFIGQTVVQKATWHIVNPHYSTILEHVIFPLLCPNETTLESFETDPQEYINRNLEAWDDNYSPDLAAISLLVTAVRKRYKTTLEPTVRFVNHILQNNAADPDNMSLEQAIRVESCLRIVSSILDRLIHPKSPYVEPMEGFLHAFVFPLFKSNYGFLRARACELCSKFYDYEFKKENTLRIIYQGVMSCFNEESDSLPVKLLAALALQTFIHVPLFQESLSTVVVPTMQKLLQLSNEFESDAVSGVMQEFVESFSTELQPFGVELMNNLVQQFLKLAIEFHEASNFDINALNASELPDESDKQLAALGILSTTISILLSFEHSTDIVKNLEQSFYPAAEFILKNDIEDFYHEACEFVENSTFLLRDISPISWKILELVGECNDRESSMVSFYLEDFMLAINNYLVYGKNELRQNSFYSTILFKIYKNASSSDENGLDELNVLNDLSQKIVLSLGSNTPKEFVQNILTDAVNCLISEKDAIKTQVVFGVTTFNVVVACLVYFPIETLQYLRSREVSQVFFEVWFGNFILNYKRVYDIKLTLMALLSMLSHVSIQDFSSLGLEPVLIKMGSMISMLLEKYPKSLRELKDKRTEFSSDAFQVGDTLTDGEWEDYDDDENDPVQGNPYLEIATKESETLKFIRGEIGALDEDFDDLYEDPLSGSVLDDINIYTVFQSIFSRLQQTDSAKYQAILGPMTQEEQSHLVHVLNL